MPTPPTHEPPTPAEPATPRSFIEALGIEVWHDDDVTHASLELDPSTWAAGTQRPRLGILAILADFVIGMPPTGILVPTVDLRVELVDAVPAHGQLHSVATMLKIGRRLAVGDAWLDVDGHRVARATATFVTPPPDFRLPTRVAGAFGRGRPRTTRPTSFEELIGAVHPEPSTTEVHPTPAIRNGPEGTVQGGIQAAIAEIAVEAALGGSDRWAATDLEVRYLGAVRGGPVVAATEVIAEDGPFASARVTLRDASDDDPDRLVGHVAARCRRIT